MPSIPPGCSCITWLSASAMPWCSGEAPPAIDVKASSKPIIAPFYSLWVRSAVRRLRFSRRLRVAVRVRRLRDLFNVRGRLLRDTHPTAKGIRSMKALTWVMAGVGAGIAAYIILNQPGPRYATGNDDVEYGADRAALWG